VIDFVDTFEDEVLVPRDAAAGVILAFFAGDRPDYTGCRSSELFYLAWGLRHVARPGFIISAESHDQLQAMVVGRTEGVAGPLGIVLPSGVLVERVEDSANITAHLDDFGS